MRFLLILVCILCSCAQQTVKKADGTLIANTNVFSRGHLTVNPDGSISMGGNSEKAAEELGKYLGALIKAGLITKGIETINPVVRTVSDAVTGP